MDGLNFARAALGQGLAMGWGDEAEAWLRSKVGDANYDQALKDIRNQYARYSQESPWTSGAAEFAGGVAPGVAMMLVPGGQVAGAAQLARSTGATVGRMAALGAGTGAIAGAGSATGDNRVSGAIGGAAIGGVTGGVIPMATRSGVKAKDWLMERLNPSDARITNIATGKMNRALREDNLTPADIQAQITADRAMGVPSVVANVSPGTARLAEAVAQRTGRGASKVEKKLVEQKIGARERTHQQVSKGLQPGDYYADEQKLIDELRQKASTLYNDAYAFGEVNDPRIMEVLNTPVFKGFFGKAKSIADMEATAAKLRGEDPSQFMLRDIYMPGALDPTTGVQDMVLTNIPDVRTLDYIKRGIDATIDSGFRGQGMSTAEASAMRQLRNQFVGAIDENVPEYKSARVAYAGDMEIKDALHAGLNDFNKMDHEQIIKMVSSMTAGEKDAFRTGVSRYLYSRIMDPSGNFNAAQRIIGSPETQAKLQPLFDNPGHYRLFKSALERESQLFHQANKILGGSQTAQRQQMQGVLEGDQGVGAAAADMVTGGVWNSLTNLVGRTLRGTNVTEPTANKLADMLMSSDPNAVAAVVKLLEQGGAKQAGRALRGGATEAGLTTGIMSAGWPAPIEQE